MPQKAHFMMVQRGQSRSTALSFLRGTSCPSREAGRQEGWPVVCHLLFLLDHWYTGPSRGCLLFRTTRYYGFGAKKGHVGFKVVLWHS